MFYQMLKNILSLCLNLFNLLLRGSIPPLACVALIIENNNRYLVIERANDSCVFPGGFMRWYEEPHQAARREGKEETGFNIQIEDFVGYQPYVSRSLFLPSNLTLIYRATIAGGAMHTSFEGRPRWLPEEEIRKRLSPIAQEMLDIYQRFLSRQRPADPEIQHDRADRAK